MTDASKFYAKRGVAIEKLYRSTDFPEKDDKRLEKLHKTDFFIEKFLNSAPLRLSNG